MSIVAEHYSELLRVIFKHDYFNEEAVLPLDIMLGRQSLTWLHNHNMVFKKYCDGFSLLYRYQEFNRLMKAQPSGMKLNFKVMLTDANIGSYTKENLIKDNKRLFVRYPNRAVKAGERISSDNLSPVYISQRLMNKISEEESLGYLTTGDFIFSIRLSAKELQEKLSMEASDQELKPALTFSFTAQKSYWKYCIVFRVNDEVRSPELRILDESLSASGRSDVVFEEVEKEQLEDGRTIYGLCSKQALPMYQRSPYQFCLFNADRLLISHLPVAAAKSLFQQKKQQLDDNLVSEIFVNLH